MLARWAAVTPYLDRPIPSWWWAWTARGFVALSALVGLGGRVAWSTRLSVVVAVAAYATAAIAVERSPSALESVPWAVPVVIDLAFLALGQVVLDHTGLGALAPLVPVALVGAYAHLQGRVVGLGSAAVAWVVCVAAMFVATRPRWPAGSEAGLVIGLGLLLAWIAVTAGEVAEAETREAANRDEIDAMKSVIVTTVAHELRTPLTIIQGLTQALITGWAKMTDARRLDAIDTIALNVASLDSSVLHFLDAGRLRRGEWTLQREDVELAPLVQQVMSKLDGVLAGREVQVHQTVDDAWVDREAVGRIMELLLVNAARFSPIASLIVLELQELQGGLELTVVDRGQGIPSKDLPHVFEPLWRGDVSETGVSRGAGLGLSIVKELAELHGGRVAATSTKGRGSSFKVWLPGPASVLAPR